MSELVQGYVPDWYVIRMNAIKTTEIIINAYCIIEPCSLNVKDIQSWNKRKDKFMKSKEYEKLHAYVSNCCKHSVSHDDGVAIFEAVYDAMKPEHDKAAFMKENTKKIEEFVIFVLRQCNESVTAKNESLLRLAVKKTNGEIATPQALAIKDHLDCIELTLDALDLTGKTLPEQICVAKSHLKCAEILLGDLVSNTMPMLF